MANEPTEEKINREVIYVYEPITSFEEKAEKFEIKSACEYMIMSEYNYWLNQELDTAKGFFTKMLFSNTSSCKKVLDYDAQELRRKNAEFKKSLCGWMPEVGKSCFSFFKNEKERNFMQVHEGKEVKYDEAKATIEKLYQEYLESLPPLFEEGVQKVKEKTPNAHVLTVDEVQKLCDSGDLKVLNVKKFAQEQVLVKHPFMPNIYMNIETSESELFHIKCSVCRESCSAWEQVV